MAFQALKSKATGHSQGLAYLTDIVAGGGITGIVAGEGISVNNFDPLEPIISTNLVAGANIALTLPVPPSTAITISATFPPIGVQSIGAGANISVDNTNPSIPVVSAVYPVPPNVVDSVNGLTGAITIVERIDGTHTPTIYVDTTGQEIGLRTKILTQFGTGVITTTGVFPQSIVQPFAETFTGDVYSVFVQIKSIETQPTWTAITAKNTKDFTIEFNSLDIATIRDIEYDWFCIGDNPVVPVPP